MTNSYTVRIGCLSAILFIAPIFAMHAYDSAGTHPEMSRRSVDLYNLFYPGKSLTAEEKQWIAQGSADEDQPFLREAYHYYDPILNQGLQGFESSKQWAHDKGLQTLSEPHMGLTLGNDAPSSFTWEDAIAAYQSGDKKRAYITLGHILHLMQDATVPANTRQDAHSSFLGGALFGGPDPYEDGAAKMNMPSISGMSPMIYPTLDAHFDAIATYTNTHFLSKDSMGFYQRPVPTRMDMQYVYGKDEGGTEYRLVGIQLIPNVSSVKLSVDHYYSFEDPLVFQDYWSRLAPRAIESGAGVIKLFQETAQVSKPTTQAHLGFFQGFSSAASDEVRGVQQVGSFLLANFMPDFSKPKVAFGVSIAPTLAPPFLQVKPGIKDISFASVAEGRAQIAQQNFANQMQPAQEQFAGAINQLVLAQEKNKSGAEAVVQNTQSPIDTGSFAGDNNSSSNNSAQATTKSTSEVAPPAKPEQAHVDRVIDGDTIVLSTGEHLRYIGINAPEISHDGSPVECYGAEAAQRDLELVLDKDVTLTQGPDNLDIYGRLLRYVWVGDANINEELIAEGYARADNYGRPHQYDAEFSQAQEQAKNAERGLWGACVKKDASKKSTPTKNITDQPTPAIQLNPLLVINEVRPQGDEFVEVYNPTDTLTSLAGYYFAYYSHGETSWESPSRVKEFPADAVIPPYKFYLIAFGDASFSFPKKEDWHPYASSTLANSAGAVAMFAGDPRKENATRIDAFGWGDTNLFEFAPAASAALEDAYSLARPINRTELDHNNNSFDFQITTVATPGYDNTLLAPQNDKSSNPVATPQSTSVTPAHVVISEVLVNGAEFVELYNSTSNPQGLSGHYLAYYSSTRTQWNNALSSKQFPDSSSVPAHGYFVVGLSNYSQGQNYPAADWTPSSFSGLSNSAGTVAIFPSDPNSASPSDAAQASLIDAVGWGTDSAVTLKEKKTAQVPGDSQSISRNAANSDTNDNSVDFFVTSPTPGSGYVAQVVPSDNTNSGDNSQNQNQGQGKNPPAPAPGIVINEIQIADSEFVELYNPSSNPVSLSSYYFAYYSSSKTAWNSPYRLQQFIANASIPAAGFYLIGLNGYATANGNPNADWQPYLTAQLSNTDGTVAIFSQDPTCGGQSSCAVAPIDAVGWGDDSKIILKEAHAALAPAAGASISRDALHTDTDNNANDLIQGVISPTNSSGKTISWSPVWALENSDARHTSQSPNTGPSRTSSAQASSQALLTLPGYAFVLSAPLVDATGNFYVTTTSATTTAIYSYTFQGTERWHYNIGAGDLAATPALSPQGDMVYIVSLGANAVGTLGKLYALRASDGGLIKSVSLGNIWSIGNLHDATSPMVDPQGNVYVCTLRTCFAFSSSLTALWAATPAWGTILGSADYTGSFASYVKTPAISNNALQAVFRAPNNTFYLLSLAISDGSMVYSHNLESAPTTGITFVHDNPSVDANGTLYLGYATAQNYTGIAAFDLTSGGAFLGAVIGSYSNQVFTQAASVSPSGTIFGASTQDNRILHFSFTPTPQAQNIFTASNNLSTPLVFDASGTMYFGDAGGTVYAIKNTDAAQAQLVWQYQFPEHKKVDQIVLGEGALYAITDDGMLHVLK